MKPYKVIEPLKCTRPALIVAGLVIKFIAYKILWKRQMFF